MYPSNGIIRLRLLFALLVCSLLSACSNLPIGEKKVTASDQQSQDASEGKIKDNKDVIAKQAVMNPSAIDPMADIQINSEIKKIYTQVSKLDKKKKFSQAIGLLNDIEAKYPQLSGPSYQKSRLLLRQDKFDQALEQADLSISKNTRNYYSHNLRGVILRSKGDFQGSKKAYIEAINTYPNYPNSYLNLGVLADLYLRDLPLALTHYRNYMKLTGNQDKKVKNWIIEIQRRIQLEKK